jgi:hypothetical protein
MEPSGVEPETSTMLVSLGDMLRLRATNCAIAPIDIWAQRTMNIIQVFVSYSNDGSSTRHDHESRFDSCAAGYPTRALAGETETLLSE